MGLPHTTAAALRISLQEEKLYISTQFFSSTIFMAGRDGAFGIANALRAGWSGDRIPVAARFSAPVQICSEAYPASYTMGTGSFPGIKRPERGVHYPPISSAEVKERVELHIYPPTLLDFLSCSRVKFTSLYHFYEEPCSEI